MKMSGTLVGPRANIDTLTVIRLGAIPERIAKDNEKLLSVFSELEGILKLYPGILTTTLVETGLQWDLPNGWVMIQN